MNMQKWLLLLYPRGWRTRYEEEFLVTLLSHPFSLSEGIDIVRGALDAHFHPSLGTATLPLPEKVKYMIATMRRSLVALFCAYSGFILAGLAFEKMTEDGAFQQASQAVSFVGISFHLVIFGAIGALLAMGAGSLPIAITMTRFALVRKRRDILFKLSIPLLSFPLLFLLIQLLQVWDHPGSQPDWFLILYRGIFLGTFLVVTIISVGAVCHAVVCSEISEKILCFALLPAALLTLSMVLVLAATIFWGLGLYVGTPQLLTSNNGLAGTNTTDTWLGVVSVMGIATGFATFSLLRGLAARSALHCLVA
jgi:hypothetical protein